MTDLSVHGLTITSRGPWTLNLWSKISIVYIIYQYFFSSKIHCILKMEACRSNHNHNRSLNERCFSFLPQRKATYSSVSVSFTCLVSVDISKNNITLSFFLNKYTKRMFVNTTYTDNLLAYRAPITFVLVFPIKTLPFPQTRDYNRNPSVKSRGGYL